MTDTNIESGEWLYQRYVIEGETMEEIAEECNCSVWKVSDRLEKHDIDARRRGVESDGDVGLLQDEEYLRQEYHEEGKTVQTIADEIGCSHSTVLDYMEKHGIETKSRGEAIANGDIGVLKDEERLRELYVDKGLTIYEISDRLDLGVTTVYRHIKQANIEFADPSVIRSNENIQLLADSEWLEREYVQNEKSTYQIAQDLDLNDETVREYLVQHDIDRRTREEALPCAEEHHNWKKDQHNYYGPNWDEKSLKARLRDQGRCQSCGKTDKKSTELYTSINFVHHITPRSEYFDEEGVFDYERANRLSNLITLCPSCHGELEGLPIDNRHNSTQ